MAFSRNEKEVNQLITYINSLYCAFYFFFYVLNLLRICIFFNELSYFANNLVFAENYNTNT